MISFGRADILSTRAKIRHLSEHNSQLWLAHHSSPMVDAIGSFYGKARQEHVASVMEPGDDVPLLLPSFSPPDMQQPALEDVRSEVIARIEYYIKAVNDEVDRRLPVYLKAGEPGAIEHAA
jgi:hypothetical protein